MAVLHGPSDNRGGAHENPLGGLGIETDLVVFINIGDVHREIGQHQVNLFGGQRAS